MYGDQIYDIAIDPTNPDKMFAGTTQGGGLFLTEDGGATWKPVLTGEEDGYLDGEATFRNTAVYAVKITPSNPNVVWATHNYWAEKSTGSGKTWKHIEDSTMQRNCTNCGGEDDDFRYAEALAVDPNDPSTVYVGASGPDSTDRNGAVYKITDGGDSWAKMGIVGQFQVQNHCEYEADLDHEFYSTVVDIATHPSDSNIVWALEFRYKDETRNYDVQENSPAA